MSMGYEILQKGIERVFERNDTDEMTIKIS